MSQQKFVKLPGHLIMKFSLLKSKTNVENQTHGYLIEAVYDCRRHRSGEKRCTAGAPIYNERVAVLVSGLPAIL